MNIAYVIHYLSTEFLPPRKFSHALHWSLFYFYPSPPLPPSFSYASLQDFPASHTNYIFCTHYICTYIPIYLVTGQVTSLPAHYLREEQEHSPYFATNASVPASSLTTNLPHAHSDIFKSRKYIPLRMCNCHRGGSVGKLLVTGRRAVT